MEVNFSLKEINETAKRLLSFAGNYNVFALHGEMGAGKTTFIHALCEAMGVNDNISSPTFSIINQYSTFDGKTIFHIDLYRLKDEAEAINAGVEDCLFSGDTCFVEWPDRAPGIFPDNTFHVTIKTVNNNARKLIYSL